MNLKGSFDSVPKTLNTPNIDNSTNSNISGLVSHPPIPTINPPSDPRFAHNPRPDMSLLHKDSSMNQMYMNYSENKNTPKEEAFSYSQQHNPGYAHNPPIPQSSNIQYPNNPSLVQSQSFNTFKPPSGLGFDNSLENLYSLLSNIFIKKNNFKDNFGMKIAENSQFLKHFNIFEIPENATSCLYVDGIIFFLFII